MTWCCSFLFFLPFSGAVVRVTRRAQHNKMMRCYASRRVGIGGVGGGEAVVLFPFPGFGVPGDWAGVRCLIRVLYWRGGKRGGVRDRSSADAVGLMEVTP